MLEQGPAGRLSGRGVRRHAAESLDFTVTGLRGENELNVELHLPDGALRYRGSVVDPNTIVGEVRPPADGVPVTFTRE